MEQFITVSDEISKRPLTFDPTLPISSYLSMIRNFVEKQSKDELDYKYKLKTYFHWDDWIDLHSADSFFKSYRQSGNLHALSFLKLSSERIKNLALIKDEDDDEIENDINPFSVHHNSNLTDEEIGKYIIEDPSKPEKSIIKSLRGSLELYCCRPIPERLLFLNDEKWFTIDVIGRKKLGREYFYNLYHNNDKKKGQQSYLNNEAFNTKHEINWLLDSYKKKYPNFKSERESSRFFRNDSALIDVSEEAFDFNARRMVIDIDQKIKAGEKISEDEKNYRDYLDWGIDTAREAPQWFKFPDIIGDDQWHSHHFLYPYYKRIIGDIERVHVLHHLVRAWFRFATALDVVSWINYGSLIGWHYNGLNLPYDADIDVNIPMQHLAWLGKNFNKTLIIEDPRDGNGIFYFEVTPWFFFQGTNGKNFIDARIIDVRTGVYIDISALSRPQRRAPQALFKDTKYDRTKEKAVRCKNQNWFILKDLIPLRRTLFEGAEAFIPHNFDRILDYKYGSECYTRLGPYHDHIYQPDVKIWVPERVCKETPANDNYQRFKNNDKDEELTLEGACGSRLLQEDYSITKNYTLHHEKEMEMIKNGEDTKDFIKEEYPPFRKDPWSIYQENIKNYGNGNRYWEH